MVKKFATGFGGGTMDRRRRRRAEPEGRGVGLAREWHRHRYATTLRRQSPSGA